MGFICSKETKLNDDPVQRQDPVDHSSIVGTSPSGPTGVN